MATTQPGTFVTMEDLMSGYGIEYSSRVRLQDCLDATAKEIDAHNAGIKTIGAK